MSASYPVIVSQEFDLPAARIWKAITDHSEMINWFFEMLPDFKAEVGFQTTFDVESGGRVFPHIWKIIHVEEGRKIVYDWRDGNHPGVSELTWLIEARDGGCTLTVHHAVIEPFDDSIPEFRAESCRGGWEYFVQGRLVDYLSKNG